MLTMQRIAIIAKTAAYDSNHPALIAGMTQPSNRTGPFVTISTVGTSATESDPARTGCSGCDDYSTSHKLSEDSGRRFGAGMGGKAANFRIDEAINN
ncbi:hypothetical protein C2E31_16740 [Rhodopirellula baltica]|nr:hypothetical protein C2E31_16740 [Rhodopirellula baltica]